MFVLILWNKQSNTIETIISKTLELWEMAASDGTIIMDRDYDKDNGQKRQVDMFCRQRGYVEKNI